MPAAVSRPWLRHLTPLRRALAAALLAALAPLAAHATPTANDQLRVLPAPGAVTVDGKVADWDLSGGILMCGDVEHDLLAHSLWLHAMYDEQFLYVLVLWQDSTPLNNRVPANRENGWDGDSLQFRLKSGSGAVAHVTAWRAPTGTSCVDVVYGADLQGGHVRDGLNAGAQEAFAVYPNGQGYVQELALPWKLLDPQGGAPKAGDTWHVTAQGNWTSRAGQQLFLYDVYDQEKTKNLEQFYQRPAEWGKLAFVAAGKVTPTPVRLTDKRTFTVALANGIPVVAWLGAAPTVAPGWAGATLAAGPKAAEYEKLVAQLGAEQAGERRAARDKIRAAGGAAVPTLMAHADDPDPEIRLAVGDLLKLPVAGGPAGQRASDDRNDRDLRQGVPAAAAPGDDNGGEEQILE